MLLSFIRIQKRRFTGSGCAMLIAFRRIQKREFTESLGAIKHAAARNAGSRYVAWFMPVYYAERHSFSGIDSVEGSTGY